jgi:putative membrane protein
MFKHFAAVTAFSAALAIGAWADDQPGQLGQGIRQGIQQGRLQFSKDTAKHYLKNLAQCNQFEIELGKYITQQTQDPQVKQFAQQMVQEHQQAWDRVQQTAQRAGVDVQQPKLDPVHQAMLDHFKQCPQDQLSAAYLFHEVASHQQGWLWSEYIAKNAQDPDIKQLATRMSQRLQQHYQQVSQLAQAETGISQPMLMGQPPSGQERPRTGQEGGPRDYGGSGTR